MRHKKISPTPINNMHEEDAVIYLDTHLPERRKQLTGGLVVCGLNTRETPYTRDESISFWRPKTFLLENDDSVTNDNLRKPVACWVNSWGVTLAPNSELDLAILPSNIFYNNTGTICERDFLDTDWDKGVKRLFKGTAAYQPSGFLFVGLSARNAVRRYFINVLHESTFDWEKPSVPGLYIGRTALGNIAVINHYAAHINKRMYVENATPRMKTWLGDVLSNYRVKQKAL